MPRASKATVALRLVKQRLGQNLCRQALLEYWGGACALTGLAIPALLRASQAKPWADCESDDERLNVFNGFLLSAHFDALFDAEFITFTDDGQLLRSPTITDQDKILLGLESPATLRWLSPGTSRSSDGTGRASSANDRHGRRLNLQPWRSDLIQQAFP
jgi:putative restriction endonuclease